MSKVSEDYPEVKPVPVTRLLTRQGRTTIERLGISPAPLSDLYHFLLILSWPRFLGLVTLIYLGSNLIFAGIYLLCGECLENATPGSFRDAFAFSIQTMATIGYGKITPMTWQADWLVAFEALFGLLGFAMATGMMFARFARPSARVRFSDKAVLNRWHRRPTLMFRMCNERSSQIIEAQVSASLLRNERSEEGVSMRRFHDLHLVRSKTPAFGLTWTAMHIIDEHSPLHGATPESLAEQQVEIVVSLVGIDESFAQTVHARWVYSSMDLAWSARFADVFVPGTKDAARRFDMGQFDVLERLDKAQAIVPPLR